MLSAALKRISPHVLRAAMSTSVKGNKLDYFEERLSDGWDPNGTFRCLNLYMPHRQRFILDGLGGKGVVKQGNRPLDGLKVLDVGCGVGLMAEMMAALGADVIGIDPTEKLIDIAKEHAHTHSPSLLPRLQYYTTTAEDHVVNNAERYDVIMAFFVLEHINHPRDFLNNCLTMLKSEGSMFIQHVNKTWRCQLLYMLWHIHVTQLLPKGVTTYSQLTSTDDIISFLKSSGCGQFNIQGFKGNFKGDGFYSTRSIKYINMIHAVKTGRH